MTQDLSSVSGQSSTQRNRANIGSFLSDFSEKLKQVEGLQKDEIDPRALHQIKNYLKQIHDIRRRDKIHKYLCSESDKDGLLLKNFAITWFSAIELIGDEGDLSEKRLATAKLIFQKLKTYNIAGNIFFPLYKTLTVEIEKCSPEDLKELLKLNDEIMDEDIEPTKRWWDCNVLLFSCIKEVPNMPAGNSTLDGKYFVENILNEWLVKSKASTFKQLLHMMTSLDCKYLIERFVNDYLEEHLDEDEDKLPVTIKAVCLLEIVNEKICEKLLKCLLTIWPFNTENTRTQLLPCMTLIYKTLSEHPEVSKIFMNIFKTLKGEVLNSSLGFITLLCICGIDRYKFTLLPLIRRTLMKIWKFEDDVAEFGWVEACGSGEYPSKLRAQFENVVHLFDDENWWKLLSTPVLSLIQSVLEISSTKEVIIVDGRVAGGPSCWLFASKITQECMLAQQSSIETHLPQLLQSIASTSSLQSALVLIDVLLEVVKRRTVEILSNWKLIDGLFDYVCRMKRDVAISLIRCLLPIISNRTQLQESLFRSLKKDLIDPTKVTAAVPILLVLLRSVSKKKTAALREGNMSQSFGSFSTQCLSRMGLQRGTNDVLSLEITGILKRCLTQPVTTKIAFYDGICEAIERSPSLIPPFMEMLISHASTTPAWTPETMVASSADITLLREPMPHLIQALEVLMCHTFVNGEAENETQASDVLINRASQLLSTWVADASRKDLTDLSLDKVAEWDPSTRPGKQTLIFANMMCSLYNTLIEHVWRRVAILNKSDDKDYLIAILNRRKDLKQTLNERTVRRKETKARASDDKNDLDLHQCAIFTTAETIFQILNKTMEIEGEDHDLYAIKQELLDFAIERGKSLSTFLSQSNHPLHSAVSKTEDLKNLAYKLMNFYTGSDCVEWIREIPSYDSSKTDAIVVYSDILRYLSNKLVNYPEKIAQIWQRPEPEGSLSSALDNLGSEGINVVLVRQVHILMTKIFFSILTLERSNDDSTDKRKHSIEFEKQAKAVIEASFSILSATNNRNAYNTVFKFVLRTLERFDSTIDNNAILKELLKFISKLAVRASDTDHLVSLSLTTIADEVIKFLQNEDAVQKYAFIDKSSTPQVCDFLISTTEKLLTSVRQIVVFASEFYPKDTTMDTLLSFSISKCEDSSDVVNRLLQFHTKFNIQKEKVAQALTYLFTALDAPVEMLLNNVKIVPEMIEWECVNKLATFLKLKMHAIMATADEHVGLLAPNEFRSNNKKVQAAKAKRDETTYVKYVKVRETFQTRVLLLSRALKDDRLDFQIRGNSIGMRDFRINQDIFEANIAIPDESGEASGDDNDDEGVPSKRPRISPEAQETTSPDETDSADVTMPDDEEEEEGNDRGDIASDQDDDANISRVY
ncbi:unnamed protein product [Auanema sp. JU1783]|nr:unnamed protein product [Auanema sp. JU1783]